MDNMPNEQATTAANSSKAAAAPSNSDMHFIHQQQIEWNEEKALDLSVHRSGE